MTVGRVACVGECMIELRERPDGSLTRGLGGDTLNTAVYLARLGIRVDYVTALGDDLHSDAMLAMWQAEGVGTGFVQRVPGRVPGLYLIQTDASGERLFSYWRDSAPVRQLFDGDASLALTAFAGASTIYLSGITLSLFGPAGCERLFAALAAARDAGAQVAFDSNFRPRGWPDPVHARRTYDRMIGASDLVFAGVEDFTLLDGACTPATLLDRLQHAGVREAVVRPMTPGCITLLDGQQTQVPVPSVITPLDTTAAGDSFAAAYLAARLAGHTPPEAARAGHRLAAVVIRHPGAIIPRDAMPCHASVDRISPCTRHNPVGTGIEEIRMRGGDPVDGGERRP